MIFFVIFFLVLPQMSFRIGILIAVLILLTTVLWFSPNEGFLGLNTSSPAPIMEAEPIQYPRRIVAEAGPNSPNQAANPQEVRVMSPEVARDPYETTEESASHPERLRHPERMFQPAPSNTGVDIADASGVASASANQANHAMQAFTPEFAQNGGEFMQGIFANDSSEPGAFSAF